MGRWYGSITNRLLEGSASPMPEVGMGATECMWSDREPYEIIAVKDERHCTARRMNAVAAPGSEWPDVDWIITPDPNGSTVNLFLTKKGRWVERYPDGHYGCNGFRLGYADKYVDPSF